MTSPALDLAALRATAPAITPERFLRYHPGCFIQYFDDTPAKNPAMALSADRFDPEVAAGKQAAGCSVCYSLQAFQRTRTKAGLLCHRNLGVDVDLGHHADVDLAKQAYLADVLSRFPLGPHWLTETAHGFHLVYRVAPARDPAAVARGEALNHRLVRALLGDENAASLTQVFRVPGTLQFKDPSHPYRCRLLLDLSGSTLPYAHDRVDDVLTAWEVMSSPVHAPAETFPRPSRRWREGLNGVAEGQRNSVAASLIGRIVARLPVDLWATAGWGGLKEWNARNASLLPEHELRAVYDSITRRERLRPHTPHDEVVVHVNGVPVWPPADEAARSPARHAHA